MPMKRYLAALLSLLLLLSLVACRTGEGTDETSGSESTAETSDAETTDEVLNENPAEDFGYDVREDENCVYITDYRGDSPHVVIPSMIEVKPVTRIYGSFYEKNHVVSVVIPDTVTVIWENVFRGCRSLETVVLSKNLAEIKTKAFKDCVNLSSITLPDTLTQIGDSAFENCTSLKHINIPASLTDWGYSIFVDSGIETIDFEEGVEYIGYMAFCNTKVKEITFPQSLRKIDYGAFWQCRNLKSVVLNEGLLSIRAVAFGETQNLTEIVIPQSVEYLDGSFHGCKNLKKAMFEGDAPNIERLPFVDSCVIYYHEGAEGFASSEWIGYQTNIW